MAIHPNKSGRIIYTGVYKVMNQATPRWKVLKAQPLQEFFESVANPTSWPTFFRDAVATAIQQELIMHQSYCPGLEDEFKDIHDSGRTWGDLEAFIKSRVRTVHVQF